MLDYLMIPEFDQIQEHRFKLLVEALSAIHKESLESIAARFKLPLDFVQNLNLIMNVFNAKSNNFSQKESLCESNSDKSLRSL